MLKIMASADFHLGMKFAGYPDVQEQLAEARFNTLQRLIGKANDGKCSLFLIAGDLFDRVSVSLFRDIERFSRTAGSGAAGKPRFLQRNLQYLVEPLQRGGGRPDFAASQASGL